MEEVGLPASAEQSELPSGCFDLLSFVDHVGKNPTGTSFSRVLPPLRSLSVQTREDASFVRFVIERIVQISIRRLSGYTDVLHMMDIFACGVLFV